MKGIFFINLIVALLMFSISCVNNQNKVKHWSKAYTCKLLDSIEITRLIAAYSEYDGYSLIIMDDIVNKRVRKLTCLPGYPIFIDSLIQIGNYEFKSRRYRTTYFVNDSQVVSTHLQKIIHPSSNWQGQTPWQETIVSTYPRLDGKFK